MLNKINLFHFVLNERPTDISTTVISEMSKRVSTKVLAFNLSLQRLSLGYFTATLAKPRPQYKASKLYSLQRTKFQVKYLQNWLPLVCFVVGIPVESKTDWQSVLGAPRKNSYGILHFPILEILRVFSNNRDNAQNY